MNFAPKDDISERLGYSAGSLGGGLQRIAEAKMQHLEQQYQQRQALKNMFEQQQFKQHMEQQEKNKFINTLKDIGVDEKKAQMQWLFRNNPKAMERLEFPGQKEQEDSELKQYASELMKILGIAQPGTNQQPQPTPIATQRGAPTRGAPTRGIPADLARIVETGPEDYVMDTGPSVNRRNELPIPQTQETPSAQPSGKATLNGWTPIGNLSIGDKKRLMLEAAKIGENRNIQEKKLALGEKTLAQKERLAERGFQQKEKLLDKSLSAQALESKLNREQKGQLFTSEQVEKTYGKIREKLADAADEDIVIGEARNDLNLLRDLTLKGNIFGGPGRSLVEKLKLGDVLTNPDTDVAAKAENRLTLDAFKEFRSGGKATNDMFKVVQGSNPSLRNTPEGRLKNIALKDAELQVKLARSAELAKFNNEYESQGKKIPNDFMQQVEKRLKPVKDEIAKNTTLEIQKLVRQLKGIYSPQDTYPVINTKTGQQLEEGTELPWIDGRTWRVVRGKWMRLGKEAENAA